MLDLLDYKLENIDYDVLKCSRCKNQYVAGYNILKYDDPINSLCDEYHDSGIELAGLETDFQLG
jgi:hypothetical protein